LLVIDRDGLGDGLAWESLTSSFEVVVARTMARALSLLREQGFSGVYVDAAQLPAVRWVGMLLQADEILDAIADGVAVVDLDQRILWANPEFRCLPDPPIEVEGVLFGTALGNPEIVMPDTCPFQAAVTTVQPSEAIFKLPNSRFLRVMVTPVIDNHGAPHHLIALTRDVTSVVQQQQKINAIHKAGDELADLTPEELEEMGVEERTDLLKYNIARHMKDLLGLDFIEIRLLERGTKRLLPLLTEGMTPLAANRELYAEETGNGVTGFVAATGKSYLCADTASDPLYIEGAEGARSSLTVPLLHHGVVIGTLNVENPQPNAFQEQDRQFLEIYARNIAAALNTLDLLEAEKVSTAHASVEAISRELALPLDEILGDAITVLDRYAGHDEDIIARLRHLIFRAREIRGLIRKVGSTIVPEPRRDEHRSSPRLAGARVLVVDAEESIRKAAHNLLGRQGAIVETAQTGSQAVALARQTPYSAMIVDIRLPDLDGYEAFRRLREVQPGVPIILMTGFGYDPKHSIVKARQEGLQSVLYKPFRTDRLIEAVEQSLGPASPKASGDGSISSAPTSV
jgi:CheY-like chemotaxis protein